MAAITLQLPDDIERKLKARAENQGRDVASVALEIFERGLQGTTEGLAARDLTPEQRLQEFKEWVESHPKVDVTLDVSRESIYEGRGE